MKERNVFISNRATNRTAIVLAFVRGLSVVAACVAIAYCGARQAHAATVVQPSGFDRFMGVATGATSQTIGFSSNGVPLVTQKYSTGSAVGNLGAFVDASSKGLEVRGTASVPISTTGRVIPVAVTSKITAASLGKAFTALASLAGGPAGLVALVAIPLVLDWMSAAKLSGNADGTYTWGAHSVGPFSGYSWSNDSVMYSSRDEACAARYSGSHYGMHADGGNYCLSASNAYVGYPPNAYNTWAGGFCFIPANNGWTTVNGTACSTAAASTITAAQAETQIQTVQPSPAVLAELVSKGVPVTVETPAVTAPSTVAGPTTTSTTPAVGATPATSTTSATTYNISTVGDTITYGSTTVNTVNNGGTVTTTTTTSEPTPDTDPCKTNPGRIGCKEIDFDTPTGTIPKSTANVNYAAESPFASSGACPADVYSQVGLLHASVKVWDWQKTCSMSLPLRALVISLASFAAFLIVSPFRVET